MSTLKRQNAKNQIESHYTDMVGIITVDRDPSPESTKNGLMSTGLTMCFYRALGMMTTKDADKFKSIVEACQEAPGNYDRYPAYNNKARNNDANAHDDYAGVFAGSIATDSNFHKEILAHGVQNFFVYNNRQPGVFFSSLNPAKWEWWAFRLRFMDHITWYLVGNHSYARMLGLPLMVLLALGTTGNKVGSGRLLSFMMVESLSLKYSEWKIFRKWFLPRSKLVESAEQYFHSGHPNIDLAKEVLES